MSASTQRLNYSQIPPRASSSRAIRNEIVPTNSGGNYTMNSQIIFDRIRVRWSDAFFVR